MKKEKRKEKGTCSLSGGFDAFSPSSTSEVGLRRSSSPSTVALTQPWSSSAREVPTAGVTRHTPLEPPSKKKDTTDGLYITSTLAQGTDPRGGAHRGGNQTHALEATLWKTENNSTQQTVYISRAHEHRELRPQLVRPSS